MQNFRLQYLSFIISVLAPTSGGASLALSIIGTSAALSGATISILSAFTKNNNKLVKRAKKEENYIKQEIENLEGLLILYLNALNDAEISNKRERNVYLHKAMS